MGFSKRLICKETLQSCFNNKKPLSELFNMDAVIFMDEISFDAYQMYHDGIPESQIKKILDGKLINN